LSHNQLKYLLLFRDSPRIINVVDSYVESVKGDSFGDKKTVIVLDRAERDLFDFSLASVRPKHALSVYAKIMLETALGIKVMHDEGVCHSDV
jgi:hypothetical protein